ncbi:AAA family ATPase [Butyrivibrio sp. TB]|uniref:AAA family ATPase n=1 Tax=Butyrivibrio sp. TB TaxID=1520809 RepID=UPI0008C71E22|nr:AAA family ATPase [Butyrivibrio sp. TB]SEQ21564.1 ATPase family associated with various cellular activities (AAA) [Butyrivibrio sp. TB]
MDKREREKLEDVLNKIQNTQSGMLGGLYGDFFGSGSNTGSKSSFDSRLDSSPVKTQGGMNISSGTEDPLADAKNALNEFNTKVNEASANGVRPATKDNVSNSEEADAKNEEPKEPEEDPMETLDKLIGLDTIKADVKELTNFVKIQKTRKDAGLKSVPVSLHLVFTGNPGTGKTTVARIISKLYKNIGVLSKGQLVETDRSGLVAGYVGQTAIKTQELIKKAMGGVLFIDEAYALSQKDDAFGQEAIDTILKAMEDHRDDLVVIVAGYTEPMEKFINSNPGLKSRFNKYIEFPDYTIDELMDIFDMNCKKYDYVIEDDTKQHVKELITQRKLASNGNFANAREIRNLFEEIITNQASRIAGIEDLKPEDMMKITNDDLFDKTGDADKTDDADKKDEPAISKSDDVNNDVNEISEDYSK